MSSEVATIRAVLGPACPTDSAALEVLDAAAAFGVDPLDYCSHRFGLSAGEVMARAADELGLAFSIAVPPHARSRADVLRLDGFATVRSIRDKRAEGEVIYVAPALPALLRLGAHVDAHPELRPTICVVTGAAIRSALARMNDRALVDESRQRLARRWPQASASFGLGWTARLVFVLGATLAALAAAASPFVFQSVLLPAVGLIILSPSLFRLVAVLGQQATPPLLPLQDESALPVYTVLVPLRDEAGMVPQLRQALDAIDYPPEKLDVKFVVEARSRATVAAVERLLDDPRYELVTVPDARPRTKPKALNYALPFVRGDYVVVYDAEDIPNSDQLRLAAAMFASDPSADCLQAELLIDNAAENWLTALFAGEYAGQFGLMLHALEAWQLPMPLGGTSNHFRTRVLREVGGWDAFNVTEDADLGVRLARLRHRTRVLPSQTYEEAPVTLGAWMRQRSRWIKGWMQTFIVHNRSPGTLLRDIGWKGFVAFELYVGSMILSPLVHCTFLLALAASLVVGRPVIVPTGAPGLIEAAIFVLGYGGSFALVVAGLLRIGGRRLLLPQLLLPFYWGLHAAAALRATYELMTRPHFWAKTTHGVTRLERSFGGMSAMTPAEEPGE